MRLPSPEILGLGAVGFGKAVLPFHLGALTPLEVAQAYRSPTTLGVEITALQGLYTRIGTLGGGTTSQNLAVIESQQSLSDVLVALVALDKAQIAYEVQLVAALAAKDAKAADAATAAAACPPGVSPVATGILAAASATAGGILGWVLRGEVPGATKRK
jgi:hypothetical protein